MTLVSDSPEFDALDAEALTALVTHASRANLESLSPSKGLDAYAKIREDDVTDATLRSHRSRLQFFVDWCEQNGIDDLNELTGRDLLAFRSERKDGLSVSTLETNMRTLRTFLQKCVKLDAVPTDLPEKVEIPTVENGDNSRDDAVSTEQAAAILHHLEKYEYASLEHVVWLLLTSAGLRVGALRSLDLRDYTSTPDGGELALTHRAASGTRLKNKDASERIVYLPTSTRDVLDDYVENCRPSVTDEFGREPLVASEYGRINTSTIRKYAYKWTRPCVTRDSCPHGKSSEEISDCAAMQSGSTAYKCPSSQSPHTVRRGYITAELNVGIPKQVVSDRCDVSPDVIDEHYDTRSEAEKMRLRREIRESAYKDQDSTGYGQ